MKIYNTLTRKIEEFVPHNKEEVTMYTCGPTVYHYAHIGNLRTYIFEDILEKTLKFLGYNVKRVMNITDVGHMANDSDTGEDKMLKGAKRDNKSVLEIAEFYTEAFYNDIERLNINRPKIIIKASNCIPEYIEMIEKLLEKGFAYKAKENIYFDISKFPNYYDLSGKNPDELAIGVRETVEEDKDKKNPFDFGLWFTKSKFEDQELKWSSPWGIGYPGWHIECSVMSINNLGEYLDIHCGGVDNIFPHHTNEIAQSEGYLGHKWCNYWIHGEHLNDISGKMSKSSGEFLTLDLLKEKGYNPIIYRFFCLSSHYRNQLVFSYEALDNAMNAYNNLKIKISELKSLQNKIDEKKHMEYMEKLKEVLSNDLNTANAITLIFMILKEHINDDTKLEILKEYDKVLSLDLTKKEVKEVDEELLRYITSKIEERNIYKLEKNYEKADLIRNELLKKGIELKDTKEGTEFVIK